MVCEKSVFGVRSCSIKKKKKYVEVFESSQFVVLNFKLIFFL